MDNWSRLKGKTKQNKNRTKQQQKNYPLIFIQKQPYLVYISPAVLLLTVIYQMIYMFFCIIYVYICIYILRFYLQCSHITTNFNFCYFNHCD